MTTFVLVHGAFHGAWCWVKLIPALTARGVRCLALDLPAQGEDGTPVADATLAANVDRVAAVVTAAPEPAVLLGHSAGGATAAAVTAAMPDRIARLIYLAAFIPMDGESVNDLGRLPEARRDERSEFAYSADHLLMSPRPETLRARYYSDCSDVDVAYAMERLRPQPRAVLRTPVHLGAGFDTVPSACIVCARDEAVSPRLQRAMAIRSGTPIAAEVPTGHSPFFSAPQMLAETLLRIVIQPPKR